jgi:hypothetical protein
MDLEVLSHIYKSSPILHIFLSESIQFLILTTVSLGYIMILLSYLHLDFPDI